MLRSAVHVHLREGDRDAVFVEGDLYVADQVEVDGPVVVGLAPGPHGVFQRAVLVGGKPCEGLGLVQHQRVGAAGLLQHLFHFIDVVVVSGGEGQVHPALLLGGGVHQRGVGDGGIGHDDAFVVNGDDLGVEHADLLHGAGDVAGGDEVADGKGLGDHQHEAPGDVGQRPLQRQADGEAAGADHRDDGGHGDAENGQRRDADNDFHHDVDGVDDEVLGGCFQLGQPLGLTQLAGGGVDDFEADDQDDQGDDQLAAVGDGELLQHGEQVFQIDAGLRLAGGQIGQRVDVFL